MALTIPRDVIVEMYLVGVGWVDITQYVRQTSPLTITRGAADEQGNVAPTKLTGVLDNTGGRFNIDNPNSPYYGKLSRNTPVRVSLRVALDTFDGRTVSNGWGNVSATGELWSTTGTGFNVSAGVGNQTIFATNAYTYAWLPSIHMRDSWVRAVFRCPFANVTGAAVEPGTILLRYVNDNDYYMIRPIVTVSEVIQLTVILKAAGTEYSLGTVTTAVSNTGANLTIIAQMEAETIRAKIFPTANVEPYGWDITTFNGYNTYWGAVALRSGIASGNTNTLPANFPFDHFEIRDVRATGEIAELRPQWDETHLNKTANLTVGGITRRLGASGVSSLKSAPYRYLMSATAPLTLTDYWPLELGPAANTPLASANGGTTATFLRETGVTPNVGAITYGADPGRMLSIEGAAEVTNGGRIYMPLRQASLSAGCSVMWVQRLSADTGGKVFFHNNVAAQDIVLTFYTTGAYDVYMITADPFNSLLLFSGTIPNVGQDDLWHSIGIGAYRNTPTQGLYVLSIDGVTTGVLASPITYSTYKDVLAVNLPGGVVAPDAFGQFCVFPDRLDASNRAALLHSAMFGHPGEFAGDRMARLCREESVPFDPHYNLTETIKMGPQRPLPLIQLLQECADTDQGILYEPRSVVGLSFRIRESILGPQGPRAILDYSNRQISPPFMPAQDDQQTVNDVTAQRVGGASYRVQQTSGPLNVQDPGTNVDGVGRHPLQIEVNPETDSLLPGIAQWQLGLGTCEETRFPQIRVNLRNAGLSANLVSEVLSLNVGDRFQVTNLTAADIYSPLDQLVRGYTEIIGDQYHHEMTVNTAPYLPYNVGHSEIEEGGEAPISMEWKENGQ